MADAETSNGFVKLRVIRGSVDSLSLFEITDYELEIFERGGPSSTYFNVSIALGSIGLSFLATLLTVEITSIKTYLLFLVISVVGLTGGSIAMILWYKTRSSMKHVCEKIRARVPVIPPATEEPTAEPAIIADDLGPTEG